MTAVEFDQEEEEINVDSDSRPGSPPVLQKPRISFSISALLGGGGATDKQQKSSLKPTQPPKLHNAPDFNRGYREVHNDSFDDKRSSSPDHSEDERNDSHDPHDEDHESGAENDEDGHEEGYEDHPDFASSSRSSSASLLPPGYLAQFGPTVTSLANSLHASGLPLNFNPHTVLRVPAHRPPVGYPPLGALGASPPPWMGPHGIALSSLDRSTALAPHFPSLDRLGGEKFISIFNT